MSPAPDGTVTWRELLAEARPLRSNFAALAIENSTAVRQFLIMAQILHHVDADAPIRMLVAECEQPTTVLAALYFAKLFGIDSKVDVSPLFETETALEHGGRFLDALLAEPAYRDYARVRGRVAIQTGFSDAGRFVGQIPAALALTGQTDALPGPNSGRNGNFQRALADAYFLFTAGEGTLQRYCQTDTAACGRRSRPATATSEQGFEEIAESCIAAHLVEIELESAVSETGWRPEIFAGTVTAGFELIILGAFVFVLEHLISLVDRLEALLGSGLLADIRMVFAGKTPVGGFDFSLAGARIHPQSLVIILEFHALTPNGLLFCRVWNDSRKSDRKSLSFP